MSYRKSQQTPSQTLSRAKGMRNKLKKCWSKETSYSEDYYTGGSDGQCYPTALVVQDELGGKIVRGDVPYENQKIYDPHFWNLLPGGIEIDLTSDQYGGDGIIPVKKSVKLSVISGDRRNKKYWLLKERFKENK